MDYVVATRKETGIYILDSKIDRPSDKTMESVLKNKPKQLTAASEEISQIYDQLLSGKIDVDSYFKPPQEILSQSGTSQATNKPLALTNNTSVNQEFTKQVTALGSKIRGLDLINNNFDRTQKIKTTDLIAINGLYAKLIHDLQRLVIFW